MQELELRNSAKKAQEAMMLAAEESAKCKPAKEVIKLLAAQVRLIAFICPSAMKVDAYISFIIVSKIALLTQ